MVDLGYLGQLRFPESLLVPPDGWRSFPGYGLPVSLVGVERRILWRENTNILPGSCYAKMLLLSSLLPPCCREEPHFPGGTFSCQNLLFWCFLVPAIPPWAKGVLGLVGKESVSPGPLLSGVILTPSLSFLPVLQASLVESVVPHLT